MKFLLPQGIGDSVWALHKIQAVAKHHNAESIEVFLNCSEERDRVQVRALDFVKRFSFVDQASMLEVSIHPSEGHHIDPEGHYIYIPDGWIDCKGDKYFALMPNGPLERGIRLENWLSEYPMNWDAAKEFHFEDEENSFSDAFLKSRGSYCTFYLGSVAGNLWSGHNRGSLWSAEDWARLGQYCQNKLGLTVVVVGADYDAMYYEYVKPEIEKFPQGEWIDYIGRLNIGETFSLVKRSRFTISYQSGIGIFSSYLGVPTGIFWRAKGDSISLEVYLSFEEAMASAWVHPGMLVGGGHLPLIYGRHGVEYVENEIVRRGW